MRDQTTSDLSSSPRVRLSRPLVRLQAIGSWRAFGLIQVAVLAGGLLCVPPSALASPEPNPLETMPMLDQGEQAQRRLSAAEVETVLPLFLKFAETRQLAADLEARIQQGDLVAAKDLIAKAVEASTFAVLASDWLQDPVLVRMLHARGIHGPAASGSDSAAEIGALKSAVEVERERRQSLEREHAALSERLAAIQPIHNDNAVLTSEVSALRVALERERETAGQLARENAAAAEKLARLEAGLSRDSAEIRTLQQALDDERERSRSLARDHAAASEKLSALQDIHTRQTAAVAEISELKRALEIEQERSLSLARDHANLVMRLSGIQFTHSIAGRKDAPAARENRGATASAASESSSADLRVSPGRPSSPLVTRAEALFRAGDVSSARLLLERASEAGDAAAIFLLGETFDPRALSRLGVIGVRGDPQKAEELYARSRALRSGDESVATVAR